MLRKILHITTLLLLFICTATLAQSPLDTLAMRAIMVNQLFPQERCYLHFDNTAYYLGETMWFKAYVTSGLTDQEKPQSRVLYVELCAPEGYVVETKKYKLDENGRCHGEFELRKEILSGYYEVRAYTRYMLNWGDEAIFTRVFPVYDNVNGDNYDFKNMLDRKRGFMYRGKWISSELPEIELNFYPEGGHLVEGIESVVAYELRDDEGKPTKDTVYIYHDNELIVKSVPIHEGMGTFNLKPKAQGIYRAEIRKNNKKYKFDIPKIEPQGVVINFVMNDDSAIVTIKNNIDFSTRLGVATINRGFIINYDTFSSDEKDKKIIFKTDSLPEGVNRIVVFANSNIPLAERQFFVRHKNIIPGDRQTAKLVAKVNGLNPNDIILQPHEKINITVEREDGKPIDNDAEFSISVSDADTRQIMSYTHNIYTHMLLGSEIKGYIPDAEQYFKENSKETKNKIDLLMLTRGWTSYDWSKLTTKNVTLEQPIEKGILIKGELLKVEPNKKMGELSTGKIIPQKNKLISINISYGNAIMTTHLTKSNSKGLFHGITKDFYGKRIVAVTPNLTAQQQTDSIFRIRINKYFSPQFHLYSYWERNIGSSIKNENKDTAIIKLSEYEYLLTRVDILGKAVKEYLRRPPRSEIRFNFLDEWEYAMDNTYIHKLNSKKEANNQKDIQQIIESLKVADTIAFDNTKSEQKKETELWDISLLPRTITASDVLKSAFWRYNFNWTYWVQLIVVNGIYNPDSIVYPDEEYIKGTNSNQMMYFKEFVIRSDNDTRKQFRNDANLWSKRLSVLDRKGPFWHGFLSRYYIEPYEYYIDRFCNKKIDGFPGIDRFHNQMKGTVKTAGMTTNHAILSGHYNPLHPNYVACFIPYDSKDRKSSIIPKLAYKQTRRYTTLHGYNRSKKFYSPDFSGKKPDNKSDYRRTLLWLPSMNGDSLKKSFTFYNNSSATNLKIDIQGISYNKFYSNNSTFVTNEIENQKSIQPYIKIWQKLSKNLKETPEVLAKCFKETENGVKLFNEKRYDEAVDAFKSSTQYSYPRAMAYLGHCYILGKGVDMNKELGYSYLKMAAEQKSNDALYFMGNYHIQEGNGENNASIAFEYYRHAAENGHKFSQTEVARLYSEGIGVSKNDSLALKWYRIAAEKDEPNALCKMGIYYAKIDSAKNLKKNKLKKSPAFKYLLRAAEQGVPEAQIRVAEYYETGRYVNKSKKKAFIWYERVAQNGNMSAQEKVAEFYEKGRGTEKSDIDSYQWYKRAAEQGSEYGKAKAKEFELFKFYK